MQRFQNSGDDAVDGLHDVPIGEPNNADPEALQVCGPLLIVGDCLACKMDIAVDLDRKPMGGCIKVDYEGIDTVLPAEFHAKLPALQPLPQAVLGCGGAMAKVAAIRGLRGTVEMAGHVEEPYPT